MQCAFFALVAKKAAVPVVGEVGLLFHTGSGALKGLSSRNPSRCYAQLPNADLCNGVFLGGFDLVRLVLPCWFPWVLGELSNTTVESSKSNGLTPGT